MKTLHYLADRFGLVGIAALVLMIGTPAVASLPSQPIFNPELSILRCPGSINIDGSLDDEGWIQAVKVTSFVENQPAENAPPEVSTTAFLTYDDKYLYVAFVCSDAPSSVRATMCQRDQFSADDAVGVMIDTYGDAAWAYQLFVNPYGVQKDWLWSSVGGTDLGFDLVWESSACITDSGYQVEIAVPFSSMRFPDSDNQNWKMDLQRARPRESYFQYSWAPRNRDEQCSPCQWGSVNGLTGVHPGRGFEVLPTFAARQSGVLRDQGDPRSDFDPGKILGEMSLGAKYAITSDVTAEATYNPDFSQIEADAAQLDVNSPIALMYPERRPFFQEGSDVFRTLFNSFYTRSVRDPEYAAKFISRKPGLTVGFMSAQDENTPYIVPLDERSEFLNSGRSWVNVLRGSRSFGDASHVGFVATDRRLEGGGYGTILGLDGNIRLSQTFSTDGQFLASFTGEPDKAGPSEGLEGVTIDEGRRTAVFDGERFQGNAFIARLRRSGRTWGMIVDYDQVEPSYRTLTGYDPWVNYRNFSVYSRYTIYPSSGFIERIDPSFYSEGRWLFDGTRRWERQNLSLDSRLKWAQTYLSLQIGRSSEAWTDGVTGGLRDYDDLLYSAMSVNSTLSDRLGYGVYVGHSRNVARFADETGWENSLTVGLVLKPLDRLLIEPEISFVQSNSVTDDMLLFRQLIARSRLQVQLNRELSLRLVVQRNDSRASIHVAKSADGPVFYFWSEKTWDFDPMITYRLNPFSVVYAGSTHDLTYYAGDEAISSRWRMSARQFFIKLQYLFQV
jgi:hypothetical protein